MKALIKVGYGCNDHCSFCHTLDVRHIDAEADEVHRNIDRANALGHRMVVLSGGEPTIRPELLAWATHVAKLDMDFGLVTNGRMLSYPGLVDRLVERRLRYVYLSLHGGTAKVHDLMVRSAAFEQTYGAIEVLSGRGLDFTVNCVITRHNVEHLNALVDAVRPYPDVRLKLSMVEPKGGGAKLFQFLMPRVRVVAERVKAAIDHARRSGMTSITHGGIPLCLMQGYEDAFDDLKTHRFATMIEVGEPDFFPVDDLNKVQPSETCRGCGASGPCPGLYKGYEEVFGHDELEPIRDRARSNSFHYVLDGWIPPAPGGGCPLLHDGVTPWDRGRHLFIRMKARVARFTTQTRDFSDAEILDLKHQRGQVYLDASKIADAPGTFPTHLRPLVRSSLCDGCPERARCTGIFDVHPDDPFARDDARVRELVGDLRGDVLDIGSGPGRYHDVLHALGDRISYRAFDPDPDAIEQLRERFPGAFVSTAEEWAKDAEPDSLDHVLVLRSWNHLSHPEAVMPAVARALRVGGELLIVDDVAYAVARTPKQARTAERVTAAFEHFRNDTASDAAAVLEACAPELEEVERRAVGPRTSTLWLLRYRRVG